MTLFQVDRLVSMFLLCSHGVNPSLQPPWTLMRENFECYTVQDASGVTMAWLFAAMTSNVTASAPASSPRRKRAGSERLPFSLVDDAASGLLVEWGRGSLAGRTPYHIVLEDTDIRAQRGGKSVIAFFQRSCRDG
jgi:hypothetical protein